MNTIEKLRQNGIYLKYDDVADICKKYRVNELSIFGSSIRDDFNINSDVDILVSFYHNSNTDLFDLMNLENEFSQLLHREVDVVEKESLKNPIRKNKIVVAEKFLYNTWFW